MKMEDVYIVVCHSLVGDEDSTVAFDTYEGAIDYIADKELAEAGATAEEIAECRESLENVRTFKYGNWEYTIYDAKLCRKAE